ncbi:zinc-binding dehydrogenase family oxidoreductase [Pseudomassariella vexata]|uniref:Zinc-binding dehydrogenase family oxidoreductase n=1 Tax=Pseudomassariella vexata TaxID=1141098 RepID=A0A1Y2D9F7_9PEZI|nr:zinc-binding dehydrogenase family oxidoreductase [Pseudomassariella vexata]ORY55899.1 zinc-binding dehydrogenase family oxidoreductase [Pseudomassariella vexata]
MLTDSTPMLPMSQTALIQDDNGAPRLAVDVPLPSLKAGTVIVKTVAIALNPSDYKMGAAFPTPGAIIGMDFSGIVASIHPDTKTVLHIGDQVCGMVHGSNPSDPTNGAFAEYIRVRPELLLRVPRDLSMEQAATLGVGLMTNVMALWAGDALALESVPATPDSPAEKPFPVLVYGGSTATGTLATQLLRLSGLEPIVTCSPRNFDLVRARGVADGEAVDYMRPDVADEIKKRTHGKLKHAYDCITDPASVAHCYAALGRTGGKYISLEMVEEKLRTRRVVRHKFVLGYEGLGEDVLLSRGYESSADAEKLALAVKYFAVFQRLLDQGKLKTHPTQKLEGGLSGVLQGLQLLNSGSVSGNKLVVTI